MSRDRTVAVVDGSSVCGRLQIPQSQNLRLRISRSGNYLTLDSLEADKAIQICRTHIGSSVYFGYFTVSAEKNGDSTETGNNDLLSLRTFNLSEMEEAQFTGDICDMNRKIIETDALRRRVTKRARRDAQLATTNKYVRDGRRHSHNLEDKPEIDICDAFSVLFEAENRATDSISIDFLNKFLSSRLDAAIGKAASKIEMAIERFDETKLDMNDVWSYLRSQLLDLSVETKNKLKVIEDDAMRIAKSIDFSKLNVEALNEPIKGSSGFTKFLLWIAVLELVAYVVFFWWKHRKTKGFRKID
jgi:hypothetical protein